MIGKAHQPSLSMFGGDLHLRSFLSAQVGIEVACGVGISLFN